MERVYKRTDFSTYITHNVFETNYPFTILFYTDGKKTYEASYDGAFYKNCSRSSKNQIQVFFDHHGLATGKLLCDIELRIPDGNYQQDNVENKITKYDTDILISNQATTLTSDNVVVLADYIKGKSAYDLDVDAGYTGSLSQWLTEVRAVADTKVDFEEASDRINIASGSKLSQLFGRIKKWFTDFAAVAFSGSYTDLTNRPTIPIVPKSVSSFTNDSNYQTDTNVNNLIGAHNISDNAHQDIRTSLSNIQAIAEGKSRARVFATVEALDTWLSDPANKALLQIGDNFYITATDVSDFWWDGTQKQKLETEKVSLTEYQKTADADNKYVAKVSGTTAHSSGLFKITTNADGIVTSVVAATKEDITALGIPAQDTTYVPATSEVDGLMSKEKFNEVETLKSDIVDKSDKIMLISVSGTTPTQTLLPNKFYKFTDPLTSLTLNLGSEISGIYNEYMCEFTSDSTTAATLSLPSTIKWINNITPIIEVSKTYQLSIVNNIAVMGGVS